MADITFEVQGKPQGKARPRMTRSGHVYTPRETLQYEQQIRDAYIKQAQEYDVDAWHSDEPVAVHIRAFFDIPKSASAKKRWKMSWNIIQPTKKPDVDNIAKVVLDALNGVAYKDDSQVVGLLVSKFYTDGEPYISVTMHDCTEEGDGDGE